MGHTVAAARLHLKLRRVGDGGKAEHLTLGSLSCPWQYLTGIYGINSRNDHQQNLRQYFSMSMQLKVVNKCWTFSSPEVFCDTAEVPKGVFACGCGSASDPAGKLPTLPKPSSQLGRGTYLSIPPPSSTHLASIPGKPGSARTRMSNHSRVSYSKR